MSAFRPVALILSASFLLWPGVAQGGAQEIPVRTTNAFEITPARSADWLAWSEDARTPGRHYNVYAKADGGERFKVNARRTQANMGGLDGSVLIYQELSPNGESDLKLYDLDARERTNVSALNTNLWEARPTMSGDLILFERKRFGQRFVHRVLLHDRAADTTRLLDEITRRRAIIAAGQVNGNWAVWQRCAPHGPCDIFRHDVAANETVKIPNPRGKLQYTPGVDQLGTVYFFRSGFGCGTNVTLRAYPIGGPVRVLVDFPRDADGSYAYAFRPGTTTQVFYTRYFCDLRPIETDLYKVLDD